MLEKAVLFYNKLLLLPESHPTKKMLKLALLAPCDTSARRVQDIMSDPRLPGPIPDVFAASVIDVNEERLVSTDSTARRRILRKYKWDVVRPAVLHLDSDVFRRDARKELPGIRASYEDLGCFSKTAISLLLVNDVSWRFVRIWYLIKLTGAWPLGLFDVETQMDELPFCRLCGCRNIMTFHVLGECRDGRRRPISAPAVPDLFREPANHGDFLQHVAFVGSLKLRSVGTCVNKMLTGMRPAWMLGLWISREVVTSTDTK